MIVYLYKFAKKEMSTEQPTGTAYSVTALLKDDTDVLRPVLELTDLNFLSDYNYCKFMLYGATRYYFINKVEYITNALVRVYCECDLLATWKTEILASTQYVVRSSDSSLYTGLSPIFNDSINPTVVGSVGQEADKWDIFDTKNGYYAVGLNARGVSSPFAVRGSVSYVIMTSSDLTNFISDLFSLTGDQADLSPIQYISSCVYIPFTYLTTNFIIVSDPNVILGNSSQYDMPLQYHAFNPGVTPNLNNTNGLIVKTHDLTIPDHNQLSDFGAFLNYEPYSKAHVVGGVLGDFDLPLSMIPRALRFELTVDHTDGTASFELCNQYVLDTGKKVYLRIACQVGVPIQLAQSATTSTMDKYRVYTSLASSLGNALTLNVGGSIRSFTDALMNAHEGNIPKVSTNGVNGSVASLKPIITMYYDCDVADVDVYHVGRPIFKSVVLNTIATGSFVKCRNPILPIGGLIDEQRSIETKLAEGIYLD